MDEFDGDVQFNGIMFFIRYWWIMILWLCFPRIPAGNEADRGGEVDPTKPVFVGDFPSAVREEQSSFLYKRAPGL